MTDGNEATRPILLNTFVLVRLPRLKSGWPVFINFTREVLLSDLFTLFPTHSLVLEILETDPVMKNANATGSYKPAKLNNGITVGVPPYM